MSDPLEAEIEELVEKLGFELVEMERAGSGSRPLLRLRIDRPDSEPGNGVSLEDCRLVSRSIEVSLDEKSDVPARYVLEVSSPGVERPLRRPRDFERFKGREIAVQGKSVLFEGAKRVEGELIGLEGEGGDERILLRTGSGAELTIPRRETKNIHLVYRWDGGGRKG